MEEKKTNDLNLSMTEIEQSELDILKNLYQKTEKQLKYTRVLSLAMVGILCALAIALWVMVPKLVRTLEGVDQALVQVGAVLEDADAAISDISDMSVQITDMSTNLNTFVLDNSETMSDAMTGINGIDFEGLNQAIQDLQDVVSPLANMMNRFR